MSGQGINPNSTSENASQGKDGDASQTSPAAVKSSADASDKSGASEKSEATGMPGSDTVNAPGLNGSAGSGVGSGVDVDGADGSASVGERSLNDEGDEEGEEEEASPFLEEFEEVELKVCPSSILWSLKLLSWLSSPLSGVSMMASVIA